MPEPPEHLRGWRRSRAALAGRRRGVIAGTRRDARAVDAERPAERARACAQPSCATRRPRGSGAPRSWPASASSASRPRALQRAHEVEVLHDRRLRGRRRSRRARCAARTAPGRRRAGPRARAAPRTPHSMSRSARPALRRSGSAKAPPTTAGSARAARTASAQPGGGACRRAGTGSRRPPSRAHRPRAAARGPAPPPAPALPPRPRVRAVASRLPPSATMISTPGARALWMACAMRSASCSVGITTAIRTGGKLAEEARGVGRRGRGSPVPATALRSGVMRLRRDRAPPGLVSRRYAIGAR